MMDTLILRHGFKIMEINCSKEDFDKAYKEWGNGKLIQDAFWFLSTPEREFILTGITPEEWDDIFPEDEYDE